MRTRSLDREGLTWRVFVCALGAAVVMFALAGLASAGVPVRQAPRSLVRQGAQLDFLRIWERGGEPPLGCEWVGDGDDFADLVLDCSGASPITAKELVCAQGPRYRRTLGLLYGVRCD